MPGSLYRIGSREKGEEENAWIKGQNISKKDEIDGM